MGEGNKLPMPVVIIVAVLALGLAGFMAYKSFGPQPVAPLSKGEQDNQTVIRDIVKRSNGNFSQVTPEDMQKLQKIAGNFAGVAYSDMKRKLDSGAVK